MGVALPQRTSPHPFREPTSWRVHCQHARIRRFERVAIHLAPFSLSSCLVCEFKTGDRDAGTTGRKVG